MPQTHVNFESAFEIRVPIPVAEIRTWSPERIDAFFGGLAKALAAAGTGGSIIVQLPTQLKTLAVIDAASLTDALEAFARRCPPALGD